MVEVCGEMLTAAFLYCRFDPSRFDAENKSTYSFVPFGFAGQRKCPGYLFSYVEVATFLVAILRKYKVTRVSHDPVEKVFGLVTSPKEDILVNFEPRASN